MNDNSANLVEDKNAPTERVTKNRRKKPFFMAVIRVEPNSEESHSGEFSRGIYSCSPMARRLIAYCVSNSYKDDISLKIINAENDKSMIKKMVMPCMTSEFTINYFCTIMGMSKGSKTRDLVRSAVDECKRATVSVDNNMTGGKPCKWFMKSEISPKTRKITMTFNPIVFKALTEWQFEDNNCVTLKLKVLGKLRSFYAMRYYEIAISEMGNAGKNGNPKGVWFFQFEIEELKTMFEIKNTEYEDRTDNFTTCVVTMPVKELNKKNPYFEISISRIKKGRKTTGFKFFCVMRSENQLKIEKSDVCEEKKEKDEKNRRCPQ